MANFIYIRDLVEKKGITIRQLAPRIGMGDTALHALIKKGSTNTATLEAIAKELDVPVGYFFDDTSSTIYQNGKGNVVGDSNRVTISGCESKLESAEKEITHLRELLQEKERTIQILMNK